MKRTIFLISLVFCLYSNWAYAFEDDRYKELSDKYEYLKNELGSKDVRIRKLEASEVMLQQQNEQLKETIKSITDSLVLGKKNNRYLTEELGNKDTRIRILEDDTKKLQNDIQTMKESVMSIADQLSRTGITIDTKVQNAKDELTTQVKNSREAVDNSISNVILYSAIGILSVLLIAALAYWLLRKSIGKGTDDIAQIKTANQKLEEQSLALDTRLAEVLARQLETDENVKMISTQKVETEPDHTLILSIANEMVRIEQNLAFMDPATKGVSQLRNRANAIAATLKSKGYEIPNLIGQQYKEGDNMEVVMEEDEDMELGIMIIRRVTRPCVLYKDKMIQSAKAVVAYNPE